MRAALAALVLAGCVASSSGSGPSSVAGLALVPAPDGLDVSGSGGRQIGFGRDRDGALATAARIAGEAPRAVACGPREGQALGDLVLVFERGTFVGWQRGGATAGRACA
ncbi:hypothetical protein JQC91_05895 [Jannaschia sp. Os4]|uniref:hypothetical protein n=1 Tax=Jannaschia sp. Os4 TaxID=2807617 RepID=UPI00193AA838|nr:hypothetical protein [Jannaschia sp. Os4]MBM2575834.1 hypothetical protein [Jannaschia sp. Os4]